MCQIWTAAKIHKRNAENIKQISTLNKPRDTSILELHKIAKINTRIYQLTKNNLQSSAL